MAANGESCGNRKRKKLGKNRKKLLVNQKVEVRSLEDGFLGSWHVGTVISSGNLIRRVRYDHLLSDDRPSKLIDSVNVTPMIDGVDTGVSMMPKNHRGIIRPLPPSHDLRTQCLQYGQCVDAYVKDAWWEGVIFDCEDGCEQRRIFFPDMGDEMVVGIDMLRLSQVWDEVTDEWEPRKNWLFLELMEEVAQDWSLPVSIKQIWYELRVKSGFQKLKDWTSSGLTVWRELALQVLVDNFKITVRKVFEELNSSTDLVEEGPPLLEFSEPAVDVTLNELLGESLLGNSRAIVPLEATCKFDNKAMAPIDQNETISKVLTRAGEILGLAPALQISSPNPAEASRAGSINHNEAALIVSSDMIRMEVKSPRDRKKPCKQDWRSVVPDLVPGPESCPEAFAKCCEMYKLNENPSRTILLNSRKHLLHLGWKIEFTNDGGKKPRMRYFSPDGEVYYSLRLMCSEIGPEIISHIDRKSIVSEADDLLPFTPPTPVGNLESCSDLLAPPSNAVFVERQYWPQAVKNYCSVGLEDEDFSIRFVMNEETRNMASKAMKHLSAMGWSFYNHGEGDQRKLLYSSPDATLFNSLHSACKHFVDTGGLTPKVAELSDVSMSKGLVKLDRVEEDKAEDHRIVKKRKVRENQPHANDYLPLLKKGRISTRSTKVEDDDDDDDSSTPVLRSCKRAREVVSPTTHRNPRTVLSWLIDNNVVLPRAKVQYRGKDGRPIAEGRVTRDGIKCSCCQKTFTLSKFEAHAGSTNHRPSANLYLEDGRSLVECQLQLRRESSNKSVKVESRKLKMTQTGKANDYICSVCHYGGELILCDNCPSSFHVRCLGLEGVPDGDWFCPTCCCGICGGGRFDKNKEQCTSSSVLICAQCEHQYHVGCLRNKGFEVLDDHIKRNWFCKETCEQIFWCLRNCLGRAVPVGNGNLTWTLMKYIKADSDDHGACDNEFLMESYSKLNIALSVMHECFEPVKESHTRRDLMEDVIFSRWSELNRLNFQGFYTVLLERNDELISVATVRIYGKKVAEFPLVATRFQYRRLGMCRILMDELEKKLMEIGVERLVLPAVPGVLNTWTSSFGFSVMTQSERLNFLDNTFLDFQDTVMCQKVLNGVCSSVSRPSTETKDKRCVPMKKNDVLDGDGADSAVSQGEQDQRSACVSGEHDDENYNDSSRLAIVVHKPTVLNCLNTGISVKDSPGVTDHKPVEDNTTDGIIKCYKRRKISAC